MSSKPRCLALAILALPFACTTDNPAFGDGSGKDESGGASTSGASVSGTLDGAEQTGGADGDAGDEATTGGDTAVCGDGVQESDEQCDQGSGNARMRTPRRYTRAGWRARWCGPTRT